MQTVQTRFLGPTDYRGARVKATAEAGSVTLGWDHALDVEANHDAAARALIVKLGWQDRQWVRGSLQDNRGNVYVMDVEWSRVDMRTDEQVSA